MTEQEIKEYYENYEAFLNGDFTEEGWCKFCESFLADIMEEHKEVFERLKFR